MCVFALGFGYVCLDVFIYIRGDVYTYSRTMHPPPPTGHTSHTNHLPPQYETLRQVEEEQVALMGMGGHGLEKDRDLRLPQVARIRREQQLQQAREAEAQVQAQGQGHVVVGDGGGGGGGGWGQHGPRPHPPPQQGQGPGQGRQPYQPPSRPGATLGQHMFAQYHLQRGRGPGQAGGGGGRGLFGAGGRGGRGGGQPPPQPPPAQHQQQQGGSVGGRDKDFFAERDGRDFLGNRRR